MFKYLKNVPRTISMTFHTLIKDTLHIIILLNLVAQT